MAQRVQVLMEDDLDGSEATETVAFSLDGTEYEIDLNDKHKEELFAVIEPYRNAARKVSYSRPSRPSRPRAVRRAGPDTTEIREWAKAQGLKVSDRGRIPAEVVAKYLARNDAKLPEPEPKEPTPLVAVPNPEFKPAEDPTREADKKPPARTGRGRRGKESDAAG